MASQTSIKREEHNYLRLNLLVVKLSTAVLKARFNKSVPPKRLRKKLKKSLGKIEIGKKKNILSQKQYDLLFPQDAAPNSDVFDVTLLVYLLRHICGLDGRSKWWTEKENRNIPDSVVEEVADIVRIRNVRNEIQHAQGASIDQKNFEEKWDVTEKAILRLSEVCGLQELPKEIEMIKNQPFDTVQEKVVVIMQSHGFDDDYRYYDDDDEYYDYDDYDDYDDYNDDSYYSDDSDSEYSDVESDDSRYRKYERDYRDNKYDRSDESDTYDDKHDDIDYGADKDYYHQDKNSRSRDRDSHEDAHDENNSRRDKYSDDDTDDDDNTSIRRKHDSDYIDNRRKNRDDTERHRYDREYINYREDRYDDYDRRDYRDRYDDYRGRKRYHEEVDYDSDSDDD